MWPNIDLRTALVFIFEHLEVVLTPLIILLLIGNLAALIAHAVALQRVMDLISRRHRPLPGPTIWISFIPVLGCLWYMFYILKLSAAIERDLAVRYRVFDSGQTPMALVMGLCLLLCLIPGVRMVAILTAAVVWLVYWTEMLQYRRMLRR